MSLATSLIGRKLSSYRIDSLLGRGGMSEVYAALDTRLGRQVALKVLNPQLAQSRSFRERFLRESRLASLLDHPHIVPVFEAGEADDALYIAMRLVDGTDLRALIGENGRLRPMRAARIITQTASALDSAHARGLIHRDVKPANILVARDQDPSSREHVYLTDFGLTKTATSESRYTETGQLVGSVHYMAPEQIEGEETTPQADVYSLGCVMFESLTGAPPYERDSDLAVLWAHVNGDIPTISAARPDIPRRLDDVVAAALAKAPQDRYASCGDLAADLQRALRRRPTRSPLGRQHKTAPAIHSSGAVEREATRTPGTRGFLRPFVAVCLALAVGGSAAYTLARVDTGGPRDSTTVAEDETSSVQQLRQRRADGEVRGVRRLDDRGERSGAGSRSRSDVGPAISLASRRQAPHPDSIAGGDLAAVPDDMDPPPQERVVTESYGPASLTGTQWGDCLNGDTRACVDFFPTTNERYMSVEIDDSNSAHVFAWIRQDIDGDRQPDGEWKRFCDYTGAPIRIAPGAVVNVMLLTRGCRGDNSAPTTGTIRVTFYDRLH